MTLDDLDGLEGFLDEWSSEGSRQQLKSPPRMSWDEFKSGREKKKFLKKSSLSQFGPYTFVSVRLLTPIFCNETENGADLGIRIAAPRV